MSEYRAQLRAAVAALESPPGCGLVAIYDSPDESFADIENVLLCNVGPGHFANVARLGVLIRRGQSCDEFHRVHYSVGDLADPDPAATRILARVTVGLAGDSTPRNAGDWWARFRPTVGSAAVPHIGSFVVDIDVLGHWSGSTLMNAVKPMLDGLISALHSHDGDVSDELVERLARHRIGDTNIREKLVDPRRAVLGTRVLVRAGRTCVVWNPADDRIYALRIRVFPATAFVVTATVRAAGYSRSPA
jgi:hypothetical protein